MLKKISTSLFLLIYLSVSTVSFAEEVVLEIVSETPSAVIETVSEPVIENIPEEIVSETPHSEEIVPPEVLGDSLEEGVVDSSTPQENSTIESGVIDTPSEIQGENVVETIPEEIQDPLLSAPADMGDILDAVLGEETTEIVSEIPTTEEVLETEPVQVEENSIFTPPGPEPEPWQPAVREDPTTESNTVVGDTQTQSDPVFLAENSVFVRRMIENVVIDSTAKHSCKVDIFRMDVSETMTSTLLVKFYGISMVAAYDAEIGSLPNGIDVRFAKNNDYIYDFRGKETTLELIVSNQDNSLTGDFTIPIIYTHKGKKESSVICQLNIVNGEEEVIPVPVIVPVVETVEPVLDPAQEFVEEILDIITPELVIEAVDDAQSPTNVEEILDILMPEIPPVSPPVELPPVLVPEPQKSPIESPVDTIPPEPVNDPILPVMVEPEVIVPVVEAIIEPIVVPETVPEIVIPVVENSPIAEPTPIPSSDVSST